MKKMMLTSAVLMLALFSIAQEKKKGLLGKVNSAISSAKSGSGTSLSNEEIVAGLKEALSVGAQNSSNKLASADGFFKDAAVKVLWPAEAQKVEKTLRNLGMGKLVDDAILSLNRAAEDASKSAAPIFVNAVKQMNVKDALGILKGADTSATSYLRKVTTTDLTTSFKPVIESSLQKVNATKYWQVVFDTYNKLPTTMTKVNPDLSEYATQKALNGIFYYVADEEKKIRSNPAARVSDILKKVFG
ncbi:MAG: DUF4197 domain-containing protein [Gemmatimonadaceae bacterium]|nr:DUF4197 domain-containing protein [Chitinophagaceae bacterium]